MAVAGSPHHSFLTGNPFAPTQLQQSRKPKPRLPLSCRSSLEDEADQSREARLAKLAIVALAAGVLTLGSVHDAVAAKSGGRVGGQAFRSAAPRPSGPRINNSRTNIYINPQVAPPLIGGYGYGVPFYSPFTFFAPGPSVAVGFGGGFEFFAALLALSAVAAVIRRLGGRTDDDEDEF